MTILFAYDGSESAATAIAAAGKLFDHKRADAVVLTIWEPLTVEALRAVRFGGWIPIPQDVTEVDKRDEMQAQQLAERGARLPPRPASRLAPSGLQTSAEFPTRSSRRQTRSTPT